MNACVNFYCLPNQFISFLLWSVILLKLGYCLKHISFVDVCKLLLMWSESVYGHTHIWCSTVVSFNFSLVYSETFLSLLSLLNIILFFSSLVSIATNASTILWSLTESNDLKPYHRYIPLSWFFYVFCSTIKAFPGLFSLFKFLKEIIHDRIYALGAAIHKKYRK